MKFRIEMEQKRLLQTWAPWRKTGQLHGQGQQGTHPVVSSGKTLMSQRRSTDLSPELSTNKQPFSLVVVYFSPIRSPIVISYSLSGNPRGHVR
jgi:hypothetical protein